MLTKADAGVEVENQRQLIEGALVRATVTVGVFHDEQVKEVPNLPEDEQPLYILPVGKK